MELATHLLLLLLLLVLLFCPLCTRQYSINSYDDDVEEH